MYSITPFLPIFLVCFAARFRPSATAAGFLIAISVAYVRSNRFGVGISMPDQVVASEQPSATQPGLTAAQALQFIKDNFVLVSAVALLIGVALSTTFLASYLSVFDWHLLWFVQYQDIITFGLLAVGVVSGSITLLQSFAQAVLAGKTPAQRRSALIVLVVLWIVGTGLNIWGAVHSGHGYFHILSGVVAFGSAVTLIFVIASHVEAPGSPTAIQCLFMLLLLVAIAASLGHWLGESVIETSEFDQDVSFKNETIKGVKVVIVLSRHTVLLKDRILYVVPTGDITKFQTRRELITILSAPTIPPSRP
jgi:hypothetical protein